MSRKRIAETEQKNPGNTLPPGERRPSFDFNLARRGALASARERLRPSAELIAELHRAQQKCAMALLQVMDDEGDTALVLGDDLFALDRLESLRRAGGVPIAILRNWRQVGGDAFLVKHEVLSELRSGNPAHDDHWLLIPPGEPGKPSFLEVVRRECGQGLFMPAEAD